MYLQSRGQNVAGLRDQDRQMDVSACPFRFQLMPYLRRIVSIACQRIECGRSPDRFRPLCEAPYFMMEYRRRLNIVHKRLVQIFHILPTMEPTSAEVIALAVVMPFLAIIALALRIFVKRKIKHFGIDDYLILCSMFFLLILAICAIVGAVDYGYGKVSNGGNADDNAMLVSTKKLTDVVDWMAPFSFGSAKLSMLFFYRSIFRGMVFNVLSWIMIVIVILWTLAFFGVVVFQCGVRIDLLWSSGAKVEEFCAPGFNIVMANTGTDAFIDLIILLMPIYWILKLHMPISKKLTVCGTFLFGALTLLSSIGRLIAYSFVYPGHNNASNQLGYFTVVTYFIVLEASLTVIACCLPTLGPLVHHKRAMLSSRRYNPSTYRHSSNVRSAFSKKANTTSKTTDTFSGDFALGKNDQYHKLETLVTTGRPHPSDSDIDGQITVATTTEYEVDKLKGPGV